MIYHSFVILLGQHRTYDGAYDGLSGDQDCSLDVHFEMDYCLSTAPPPFYSLKKLSE